MAYVVVSSIKEFWDFLVSFWFVSPNQGITFGMRLEILMILGASFMYAMYAESGYTKSLLTVLGVYLVISVSLLIPSLASFDYNYGSMVLLKQSLFGQNFLHPDIFMKNSWIDFETHFDGVIAQILYLIIVPLGLLSSYRWNKKKLIAIIKNSRPERVAHYFFALSFGILLAYKEGVAPNFLGHWLDFTTIIILYLSFYFAWMFAVAENDIVDSEADALTNSTRPLVTGIVSKIEMESAGQVFLLMSLLGSYLVGPEILFMNIVFLVTYHIYSCPPLHLKRFAIINSSLVALVTLSAIMAGFFTFNGNGAMASFPSIWVTLTIVLFTLFLNIKDIKDTKGDAKFGIYTIPVIFGERNGKRLIWLMMTVGLIIVPLVLNNSLFWLPSIIASIVSWSIIHRNPYNEKFFFILYLAYFIFFAWIYFL